MVFVSKFFILWLVIFACFFSQADVFTQYIHRYIHTLLPLQSPRGIFRGNNDIQFLPCSFACSNFVLPFLTVQMLRWIWPSSHRMAFLWLQHLRDFSSKLTIYLKNGNSKFNALANKPVQLDVHMTVLYSFISGGRKQLLWICTASASPPSFLTGYEKQF